MNETWYSILGVPERASEEGIRAAWRSLMQRYHPDRNREPGSAERAKLVNVAYQVLSDPERRAAYDAGLARQRATIAPEGVLRQATRSQAATPPTRGGAAEREQGLGEQGLEELPWWFVVAILFALRWGPDLLSKL
jgi:DnaJ-class molecular chaperone